MGALSAFAWAWSLVRDVATVIRPCRFSIVIVLAGFVLLFTYQGQELTVRLPDEGYARIAWFKAAVLLWALESWYWARLLLDATFGSDRKLPLNHPRPARMHWLVDHTPRILALAAYAIATVPCVLAEAWWIALTLFAEGVLFYMLLVKRRSWFDAYLAKRPAAWKKRWFEPRGDERAGLRSLPLFSFALVGTSVLLAIGLTVWVCVDAVAFGSSFGSAAIPFLGFAMIVPVGSLAVYFARYGGYADAGRAPDLETSSRGYPVVVSLLLLALIWSLFPVFDNHGVRKLSDNPGAAVNFTTFVENWQARGAAAATARPVIVATAGGGLRAAYWTATVLGRIQDEAPEFREHLLAISGVSGGSLGATVFVTLLGQADLPSGASNCSTRDAFYKQDATKPYECAGQAVLSQDFLAPAVAGLLFPDLIQRFAPLGFPDRAQALEQSWERAWTRVGFEPSPWVDKDFRDLWLAKGGRLPALFLNGTHVESGKRVITSNVRVTLDSFPDAYDFFDLAPHGIRPSTAAHNSARFTYVSPAATLKDRTHLVDGGYFENFGAATARQVLRTALATLKGPDVRPIVILISNDPKLQDEDFPLLGSDKLRQFPPKVWAGEVLSPLRAMLHTRDARGLLAVAELRIDTVAARGHYFQFRLCVDDKGRADPALGWVLSQPAEALMREQMRGDHCRNADQLKQLIAALRS